MSENPERGPFTGTPTTLGELGTTLFEALSGRGESIDFQFDDAEFEVPGSRSTARLDGTLRVTAEEPG